jgi:hypothetical protein
MTLLEKKVDALMRFAAAEEFERDALRTEIRKLMCEDNTGPSVTDKEVEVRKVLMELGAPENHSGYAYMIDAILLAMEDDINMKNMTWGIYAPLSVKHSKTIDEIRSGISRSVEKVLARAPYDLLQKYFYGIIGPYKNHVTAGEFIGRLAVMLKYGSAEERKK